jgi:hypothetical protein
MAQQRLVRVATSRRWWMPKRVPNGTAPVLGYPGPYGDGPLDAQERLKFQVRRRDGTTTAKTVRASSR